MNDETNWKPFAVGMLAVVGAFSVAVTLIMIAALGVCGVVQ